MTPEAIKVPRHYLAARKEMDMLLNLMHRGNPIYEEYLAEIAPHDARPKCIYDFIDPPLTTDFWRWMRSYKARERPFSKPSFLPSPPVPLASASRRVFFVGTGDEITVTYASIFCSKNRSLAQHLRKNNLLFCHDMSDFWEYFFGCTNMLDTPQLASVPSCIYSTGRISLYKKGFDMNTQRAIIYSLPEDISDALAAITDTWDIPLKSLSLKTTFPPTC